MSGINKAIIIGRLGKEPEVRYAQGGTAVCSVSVATSESWKDKESGKKKDSTEWHNVVFWGRLAEIVGEYLKKGSLVYVGGKLQTRKWQDKNGNDRYTTEIVAREMQMLGDRKEQPDGTGPTSPDTGPEDNENGTGFVDDEIPW